MVGDKTAYINTDSIGHLHTGTTVFTGPVSISFGDDTETLSQALQKFLPQQLSTISNDIVLGSHIERSDLTLLRTQHNCFAYEVLRKNIKDCPKSLGSFSFMTESNATKKQIVLSSFDFDIHLLKEDKEHRVTIDDYLIELILGLVSSAFESYEVQDVSVEVDCLPVDAT